MYIDLGANTCFINQKDVMQNMCQAKHSKGLCQIAGIFAIVE